MIGTLVGDFIIAGISNGIKQNERKIRCYVEPVYELAFDKKVSKEFGVIIYPHSS